MRRIVTSGLAALAVLLGGAVPAAAALAAHAAPARTAAPAQALATTPVARAEAAGSLITFALGSKISCGSPTACLAVGTNFNSSGISTPAAEAWNGTAWKSVAVKTPKGANGAALTGVSCKSATSCLVVGAYGTNSGNGTELPYAMTWNGTSLTPTAKPPVPKGNDVSSLDAVSCVTARSCVAVGTSMSEGIAEGIPPLVVETWNGTKWALRTARTPGGAASAEPAAISCLSVTSCVVAGTSFSATSGAEKLLLARWNGKALAAMKAAAPAGANAILLINDVSCTSVKRCVAAGLSLSSTGTSGFGFTEVLNGTSWTTDKVTWPRGDTESFVTGVSCLTPTSCVAVGAAGTSKAGAAKALSYNGRTWSQLSVPGPGKGKSSVFTGVSCPKVNDCVAIGEIGATNNGNPAPLAGLWNGQSWKLASA